MTCLTWGMSVVSVSNSLTWDYSIYTHLSFNTLRPRQNCCHLPDNSLKLIFFNQNSWISINISLQYISGGLINNNPALVDIKAWCQRSINPLFEPMMVQFTDAYMCYSAQWVKDSIHLPEFAEWINGAMNKIVIERVFLLSQFVCAMALWTLPWDALTRSWGWQYCSKCFYMSLDEVRYHEADFPLPQQGQMMYKWVRELGRYWLHWWFGTFSAASCYLNSCELFMDRLEKYSGILSQRQNHHICIWMCCLQNLIFVKASMFQLIGPWEIWMEFYVSNFQTEFSDRWLRYHLWNLPLDNCHWTLLMMSQQWLR